MGAVYGARHERLRKKAAIKVIAPNLSADQSAVERFEQEALALAQLSHPNIVAVLSIGTLPGDGRSYYLMEWLEGESLHDRLERGRVPYDDALDILDQIARGLDAAHAAGIVHRDLKPDNCWLQEVRDETRRIVKILDLGLAKLAGHRRSERDRGQRHVRHAELHVAGAMPIGTRRRAGDRCLRARLHRLRAAVRAVTVRVRQWRRAGGSPRLGDSTSSAIVESDDSARHRRASDRNAREGSDASANVGAGPSDDHNRVDCAPQVRLNRSVATAQPIPASIVPTAEPHAGRRVFVALAGVVVLGAIIVAAVVESSGAKPVEVAACRQRAAEQRDRDRHRSSADGDRADGACADGNLPGCDRAKRYEPLLGDVAATDRCKHRDFRSNVNPDSPPIAHPLRRRSARVRAYGSRRA